eukprot:gene7791-9140_t
MSDLTHAFDFDHPVTKFTPISPVVPMPSKDINGKWNVTNVCEAQPGSMMMHPPYGSQEMPVQDQGYKKVLGHNPSEGRTYIFEIGGVGALQSMPANDMLTVGRISITKDVHNQYFIMTQSQTTIGVLISTNSGKCLHGNGVLTDCTLSDTWVILDQLNGKGHLLKNVQSNQYLCYQSDNGLSTSTTIDIYSLWTVYAVTPTPLNADSGDITTEMFKINK